MLQNLIQAVKSLCMQTYELTYLKVSDFLNYVVGFLLSINLCFLEKYWTALISALISVGKVNCRIDHRHHCIGLSMNAKCTTNKQAKQLNPLWYRG